MIRRFLLIAVVVLVPSFSAAQANRDAIAKESEANERAINAAIQKGDVAASRRWSPMTGSLWMALASWRCLSS